MLTKLNPEHILFLDIETVPQFEDYNELSDTTKSLWEQKTQYQRKDEFTPDEFYIRAGIWAEFGKIICISVGHIVMEGATRKFRVTSFHGEEITLLKEFKTLLETHFNRPYHLL